MPREPTPSVPADTDLLSYPITKKKFNVYLNEEVVKEAKDLGLNISKICENALILYVNALKKSGVSSPSNES